MGKVVCVTGASGFIASWLVKFLLERGYTVKGTVRNPNDPKKVAHLMQFNGAKERLHLYEAHLMDEGCFDSIIDGCEGVFHMATPVNLSISDPQRELIDPAVKGTVNVLNTCKKVSSVKRVVITSSMAAVMLNCTTLNSNVTLDETWISDLKFLEEEKSWYALSKTLAEKETWKFVEENDLDIVMLHPGYVIGPLLQPTVNVTSEYFLNFITMAGKQTPSYEFFIFIDVRDVALAHILALENSSAKGRCCLVGSVTHYSEALEVLSKIFPDLNLSLDNTKIEYVSRRYQVSQQRAKSLGINFTPLEESLKDTVESFEEKNLLTV